MSMENGNAGPECFEKESSAWLLRQKDELIESLRQELDERSRRLEAFRAISDMYEMHLDKDWRLLWHTSNLLLLSTDFVSLRQCNAHLREILNPGDFEKIENYFKEVTALKNLPYDEGEPWNLRYRGFSGTERIGREWLPYCYSGMMNWTLSEGSLIHRSIPDCQDDSYLMTAQEYGGAGEDLRVVFRCKTPDNPELIRDISLVICGLPGQAGTHPDLVGYTLCSGSVENTQGRIQRWGSNLFVIPEKLEPGTEYLIEVERIGGRLTRRLTDLTRNIPGECLTAIDPEAVYDRKNHVGFTTYNGNLEISGVEIFTRPSRFRLEQFRIPCYVEVGLAHSSAEGRTFSVRFGDLTDIRNENIHLLLLEDITERKRAEEQLERESVRRRTLFDQSPDGILVIDTQTTRFLEFNTAAHSQLGYTREEFAKLSIIDIEVEETAEQVRKHIAQVIREGKADFETRQRTRQGEIRNVHVTAQIVDVMGHPVYQCTWRDITERKRAAEALALSELRLRLFIDASSDLMFLKDLDLKYQMVNAANAAFYRRKESEILGKTDAELLPEQAARFCRESDLKAIRSKRHVTTIEMLGDDVYEVHKFPVIIQGKVVGVAGVIRDVTENRQLEAKLIQAQKMESVGRLAGGVAHDFNNKLGVIIGYADMALDQLETNQPLYAELQEIYKAAMGSADLTRQLLAFARKQTVSPRVLDLNETIEGMLKMLKRLIGEDIDLAWCPGADLWPVKIDPSQIDQILANLCVNSRDAITDVGKITIQTGNCSFDADYCASHMDYAIGDYILLSVTDDGCGMDKETLRKLFEPFFTTKKMGEGTGLGLAMVYGAVRQNNGFINVYSEPGQGTTMKIYLPRYAGTDTTAQAADQHDLLARGDETILVIEDDSSHLKLVTIMLERLGYTVLAVNSPVEAMHLASLHAEQIQLFITDIVMPGMNGRDLAAKLKELNPELKSLYMSGYTADVIAHHGILESGVNYIQKPFSLQELAFRVRQVLDSGDQTRK